MTTLLLIMNVIWLAVTLWRLSDLNYYLTSGQKRKMSDTDPGVEDLLDDGEISLILKSWVYYDV